MHVQKLSWIILLLFLFQHGIEAGVICEGGFGTLRCGSFGTIRVIEANYGRTDRTTCVRGIPYYHTSNTRCKKTVTNTVSNRCNGRKTCVVHASNTVFGEPCVGTYKYLALTYQCASCSLFKGCCLYGTIRVIEANYGRTDRTTCARGIPFSQTSNTRCKKTVTNIVANRCNGRKKCDVHASNTVFGDPCGGTYKYLYLTYACRKP
ncbi:unnamed protein product [Leuciscus chuanchicus]